MESSIFDPKTGSLCQLGDRCSTVHYITELNGFLPIFFLALLSDDSPDVSFCFSTEIDQNKFEAR